LLFHLVNKQEPYHLIVAFFAISRQCL
jgi:hypothetical protein